MPSSGFPAAAPSLTGDVLQINRFLQNPAAVNRRMRTLADQQFVADKILTGKVETSGGAIAYGVGESIYSDRDPGLVNAGGEYPRALTPDGQAQIAKTSKYGQDVPLTDEKIGREKGRGANQILLKSANRTVRFVDTTTLAVIAAAVTQTQAAASAWSSGTADPLLDVMLAQATIDDLGEGYEAKILVTTKVLAARLVANPKVIGGVRREENPTITEKGELTQIGGLRIIAVPAARMPAGVSAIVLDPDQLGFMGYEDIPSPEYSGPADGLQTWVRRNPAANDSYLVRSRRVFVPVVQEPLAAIKITGV